MVAGSGGSLALYDLTTDPWMDHDLAPERPDAARALAAEAERLIPMGAATGGLALDPEQLEALRAMGYVER